MAKILITFLGTGPNNKGKSGNERHYIEADYCIENQMFSHCSFVAEAITKYYNVDRIIMIGTVRSMWERVYEIFSEKGEKKIQDVDYWAKLSEFCDNASYMTPIDSFPDKCLIESALGKDSKVEIINYGIDQAQLEENANIILGLEQYFQGGDELIIDITHSFRSLPLYLMNLLLYLKNNSKKNVSISHILYGMLDISREMGFAPVVDLIDIIKINDWIMGAYNFSEFGNAYKIAELLNENDSTKTLAKKLDKFTTVFALNQVDAIRLQTQELAGVKTLPKIAELTIKPTLKEFMSRFNRTNSNSRFQLELAQWNNEHKQYGMAFFSAVEAIVTYVCETQKLDWQKQDDREEAKKLLRENNSHFANIKDIYFSINHIRNEGAHSTQSQNSLNYKQRIRILQDSLDKLNKIITK